ncbi:MAG: DinB family protein [Phycisphaerales bacterium]
MAEQQTRQQVLAHVVRQTVPLTTRFLVGFDESSSTRQAPGLPNHVSWSLGHLALTLHRAAEKFDGVPAPSEDFVVGALAAGDRTRFATESVAFGSTPVDEAAHFPPVDRARAIFERAAERLAGVVERAADADLERQIAWGTGTISLGDLVVRVAFHNGIHAGQITDLRRGLGMGRILG